MHSVLEILASTADSAGPDLISLDDLKLALGIEGTDQDAALQSAITSQSQIIAEYCDRRFGFAEAIETFTFDRYENTVARQALTLSLYPVAEVIEVSIAGATAGDYDFDPTSGRLWPWGKAIVPPYYPYPYYGTWGGAAIAVHYSGGYDLPENAPARLARAVIDSVNAERTSGARDPGIREVQHGDTRVAYFTPGFSTASSGFLTASAVDLIKPYRRLTVA